MKKQIIIILLLSFSIANFAQTAGDLFKTGDAKIIWLGVVFSHVKLIGITDIGEVSTSEIRDKYFRQWNYLILSEPDKYDINGMLYRWDISSDIEMVMNLNAKTNLENMETYNAPQYTKEDIEGFVKEFDLNEKEGIGVLFLAECLNKIKTEAYFHFVAINMNTKEVLLHERLRGVPSGFGLRNYWAGAIYRIIKDIKSTYYKNWKRQYSQ